MIGEKLVDADTTPVATTFTWTATQRFANAAISLNPAALLNTTSAGTATATGNSTTSIAVSMPYGDDANGNNTYTVDYKLSPDSTWTNWVTGAAHVASPYATTITGLTAATSYDVRVTYIDGDGVTGTNPQTISGVNTQCTLTVNNGSNGTVALNPTGGTYAWGTVVTLTATGNTGYILQEWSGDLTGNANPTTITMDGNKTVNASWMPGASVRISASSDDAEERTNNGAVDLDGDTSTKSLQMYRLYGGETSSTLNWWGLRFLSVNVPVGATIISATITFRANLTSGSTDSGMTFRGQLAANPGTFTTTAYDITNRTKTSASVSWTVPQWTTGLDYRTPDLTAIIQDIVNQSGWAANNAMVIIGQSTATENRSAISRDSTNGVTLAPLLTIAYTQNAPTITTSGALTTFYSNPGVVSAEQFYTVTGSNLSASIVITAPTDFEISTTSGSGFGATAYLTPISGTVAATPIYVRFLRATAGTSSGNIAHGSAGATQKTVAVTGTAGDPLITVSSSMTAFSQPLGSPSPEQTYSMSGSYLKGNLTVTAPTDFEISKSTGSGFGSSLTFTPTNTTVPTTTVYVRMNRSTEGSSSGDIAHTSTDALTVNVPVSGTCAIAPTTIIFQDGLNSYTGTRDTYIWQTNPTTVRGSETAFAQDYDSASVERRSLLLFDLSSIPAGASIDSAQLRLYVMAEGQGFYFYRMLTAWDEATVTYASLGSRHFQADDVDAKSTADVTWPGNDGYTGYITLTVPAATIQDWLDGTLANNGWLGIAKDIPGGDGQQEYSREWTTQDQRPRLTVNYYPPSDKPTITLSGTPLSAFSSSPGVPSAAQIYTVTGSHLTADIYITATTHFEISTDGTNYYSTRMLGQSGGSVAATPIYVRLNTTTEGTHSGNIAHTSTDATTRNVALSGTVTSLAPNAPTLVQPADDATCVVTPPTLEVTVSDPDSATVNVSFYGRPTGGTAADFTLIVLPDSQKYADPDNYPLRCATFYSQTQWIADQTTARNIVFVTHVGDIVENDSVNGWAVADAAFDVLDVAGVPYSVGIGNNDFTGTNYGNFEANFGVSRFSGKSWYGGHYGSNNVNSYSLFSAAGMDFIVINLNYNPSAAELTWADGLLTTYSSRRAIVESHNQLNINDTWSSSVVFDALKGHANLFLLLSGHLSSATDGAAKRTDVVSAHTIYSTLQDYQLYTNVNNGYLRIYQFSPAHDVISMTTYSPTIPGYETADPDDTLAFAYTMPDGAAYQLIGTATGVASGANASVVWSGLSNGTEYEWYAVVSDTTTNITGPTWSFTPGDCTPTITTDAALTGFSSTPGGTSDEQSYMVSGSHLTGNIVLTAPADFEISTTSGSGFGSTLSLIPSGGTVLSTTIYVRFGRATRGNSSGDITHTSSGATPCNVGVTGTADHVPQITLVRPTNGAVGVVRSVLGITITDGDLDPMTVSFWGQAAGGAEAAAQAYAMLCISDNVASGATVYCAWEGLEDNTHYQWYAFVDDALVGIGSDVWGFTTGTEPTAIPFTSFAANATRGGIALRWDTASEVGIVGFHVYRATSADGERERLTASWIPGEAPGSASAGHYAFVDITARAGVTYYYWLEALGVSGASQWYGPVSARASVYIKPPPPRD